MFGSDVRMSEGERSTDTRFAIYGSLAPGRVNHVQLAALKGRWRKGVVKGRLVDTGWGAAMGYPGLVLDPQGSAVDVHLLESPELPEHWDRLDAFEGSDYRRVVARVSTADGDVPAWIYVVAE